MISLTDKRLKMKPSLDTIVEIGNTRPLTCTGFGERLIPDSYQIFLQLDSHAN